MIKIISSYIIAAFSLMVISSCWAYRIYPKEDRNFVLTGEKKEAFIVNSELKRECKILKASGVYKFVSDSNIAGVTKIKLYPIHQNLVCGQPILLNWITLGLF